MLVLLQEILSIKIQTHFEDLFDANNFEIFDGLITAYRHNVTKKISNLYNVVLCKIICQFVSLGHKHCKLA